MIGKDLLQNRAGALPSDAIHANRLAKMRELDAQLSGLFITRAATSGVTADESDDFMDNHVNALMRLVEELEVSVAERIARAEAQYRWQ